MYDLYIKTINLKREEERERVHKFLEEFDLKLDNDVDYTLIIEQNEKIKATCSKAKNVFKCFAVSKDLQGENVTSKLISALIDKSFEEGIFHNFIFTKPDKEKIFASLNFKTLYKTDHVAFLEYGIYDIGKALDKIGKEYNINNLEEKTALVMNCNPFTLGHRYLIEYASKNSKEVIVFIVQEDKSLFPFKTRYNLVKEGTKDLENVKIIPGGEYIISSATFPTYFIREEDILVKAHAEIDAGIFGKYFGEKFNIKKRYVGEEPYCKVTNAYNQVLKNTLPKFGIELEEIKRKESQGEFISASKVRALIREDKLNEVKSLVPSVTWGFLNSDSGKEIVEKIKKVFLPINMKDYTAMDILLAREERVEFQNTLLEKYKLPMLCLRVNYPGVIKDNETSRGISNILKAEIEDKFDTQIVYKCYKVTAEGPILILIIDNIAEEIKKYSIYVEQNHLLGRCVDIDVYNVDGTGISRTYLGYKPRKCFICEDMAQNCVRSRKHSMEQVINYIEEQYKKFNNIKI